MEDSRHERGRMPIAEDLDDIEQLRRTLLDRDQRLVRIRAELIGLERWIEQVQAQAGELVETADNARAAVEHLRSTVPDLLEPEVEDLTDRVRDDARGIGGAS